MPTPHDPAFRAAYVAAEQRFAEMNKTSIVPDQHMPATLPTDAELPTVDTTPMLHGTVPKISKETETYRYFTPEEVSLRWREKITTETLANWRSAKVGPAYSKFGKAVLYRSDLLEQWEQKYLFICDPVKIGSVSGCGGEA